MKRELSPGAKKQIESGNGSVGNATSGGVQDAEVLKKEEGDAR
jgi:hypothetical protein